MSNIATTLARFPVSSFGPELLQSLIDGTRARIEIEMAEPNLPAGVAIRRAKSMRARLHQLRKALRTEKHPYAEMVMRAKCSIEGTRVVIAPRDSEFIQAIRRAGVGEASPPTPPKAEALDLEKSQPVLDKAIENFLDSISPGRVKEG